MKIHAHGGNVGYWENPEGRRGMFTRFVLCEWTETVGGPPERVRTRSAGEVTCWKCLRRMAEGEGIPQPPTPEQLAEYDREHAEFVASQARWVKRTEEWSA